MSKPIITDIRIYNGMNLTKEDVVRLHRNGPVKIELLRRIALWSWWDRVLYKLFGRRCATLMKVQLLRSEEDSILPFMVKMGVIRND